MDTHRNAQRLLRPLAVVNPFAPRLTFRSDRTRTRRDHVKYLTLIRTIALLHQHQRTLKREGSLEYIEATLADIEAANRIAHEVLGRSLDELPPQTRRLLGLLQSMLKERCEAKGIDLDQVTFSRREVRAYTGWSEFQTRTHLNKHQDMEYILPHVGSRGQSFVYELAFDGDPESAKPQLIGLIDAESLESGPTLTPNAGHEDADTITASSAVNGASSGKGKASSIQRAPNEPGSSNGETSASRLSSEASGELRANSRNRETILEAASAS